MNENEIKKRIKELSQTSEWNHYYEFPNNIKTKKTEADSVGNNSKKWKRLEHIITRFDLSSKSVIDVGCSDGFFSIQCAQLGCESVLGIDADELRIERAKFAAEVFELKNVRFETTDIYQREMSKDRFDIVLALGILHRIPDIYGFLDRISGIGDILILEFKTLRSFFPVCRFGGAQQKGNEYNKLYFLPSVKFVTEILSSLGFTDFEFYKDKSKLKYKRTILVSSKNKPIS